MSIKTDTPTNLRPVLLELINLGMRQAEIAREIGLSRATVNIVLKRPQGWMPSYETGKRLIDLAQQKRKKSEHA